MNGDQIPTTLLKQNNVLIYLDIKSNDLYINPFMSASIIKICNSKQKGFTLAIKGSRVIGVDDYNKIVKSCP